MGNKLSPSVNYTFGLNGSMLHSYPPAVNRANFHDPSNIPILLVLVHHVTIFCKSLLYKYNKPVLK